MLLEDFDRAGARATFFVLGWVAEKYPQLVAEIQSAGHDIGTHGFSHTRVYELEPDGFAADLRKSLTSLAGAGATQVAAFRAPEWSINDRSLWALEVLAREGISVDASMAPVRMVGREDYPRAPHRRRTASGADRRVSPARRRPLRLRDADGLGVGPADVVAAACPSKPSKPPTGKGAPPS